jgi:hypothetical protein
MRDFEKAQRIKDVGAATARLLRLLAVDGEAFTSSLSSWTKLTTRQVHHLLRRSGRATMKHRIRDRYNVPGMKDINDYSWELISQ